MEYQHTFQSFAMPQAQQHTYYGYPGFQQAKYAAPPPMHPHYHHSWATHPYMRHMKTESKPRLSKEEVEQLESEFQKNYKPSSSTKKALAEQLGVDVARINNWFQNRRAKKKQMDRAAAIEANRQAEAVKGEPGSPEGKDYFGGSEQNENLVSAKVALGSADATPSSPTEEAATPEEPALVAESTIEEAGLETTAESADLCEFASTSGSMSPNNPAFSFAHSSGALYVSTCDYPSMMAQMSQVSDGIDMSSPPVSCSMSSHVEDMSSFNVPLMLFPSSNEDMVAYQQPSEIKAEHDVPHPSIEASYHPSPDSLSQSPPMPSQPVRIKSPPAVDLAARRKRPGLTPLGIRNASHGPVTGYFARPMDPGSPLRRAASATGFGPQGVRKMTAPPRSPYAPERRQDVIYQQLQQVNSPPMMSGFPNLAPPTPNTPIVAQPTREGTASSSSSDDDKSGFYNSLDQNLRTPPATPINFDVYAQFGFAPVSEEQPLLTPNMESFGVNDMSAPNYVTENGSSQPPTPGLYPSGMNHNVYAQQQFNWATGQMGSGKGSPSSQRQGMTIINMTPENFSK